ncbi:fumarylacetoacetate hydrolase family protein [Aquabacter spiritensis]|uniref:2-keto-4-pentenoate hydratase/2-oxohepta-3-ene-1,7-dioic acid hydratase in catechol pathway n=1 Tax=Aquabacter spiritensis TaxID=933073 RepID=A0A4R3LPB3_9HYPH|nr:fumarylacetoacetate hydrolase family protein [Aquabacter spiritensis]TCT02212.1 2-keto-4-pentenoate hydratase/2-oxohepta-3-ene-1,7-dioic acid hydratase in catechol pathway [Aquabacter spiritensis]
MPLAVFSLDDDMPKLGKVFDDGVVDLSVAAPGLPKDVISFLRAGEPALAAYRAVGPDAVGRLPLSSVRLHPPVPAPEKYLAIGMNYSDHGAEARQLGLEVPPYQLWFNKQVSCIVGPYDDVVLPRVSEKLDYEAELAVVIGKACRYVTPEAAPSVIAGYMVANDVSARDWQLRTGTMTLGKSFDTHGPTGPWLTLAEEIADPHDLEIRMLVNGEVRQHGCTSQLIHNIWEQVSYLTQVMTLKPGDILATGTPSGVGVAKVPPVFLRPGDVMWVEIAGLGYIENRVVAEA